MTGNNFQSNITFKGKFDISEILSSIKQMREQLAKNGDVTLIGDLDRQIKKVESLGSTIQAQIGKGFSSQKEFSAFESNINKLELELEKVGNDFDGINVDNLNKALSSIKEQVKELEKNAKKAADTFSNAFKTSSSKATGQGISSIRKEIVEMAKDGKTYEEAQQRLAQIFENQLKTQKEQRQELEKQKSQIQTSINNSQTTFANVGLRTNNFNALDGSQVTKEQVAAARAELEKIIPKATDASAAIGKFNKYLASVGLEAKNNATMQSKVTEAFNRYQSSVAPAQIALKNLDKEIQVNEKETSKIISNQQILTTALANEKNKYNEAATAGKAFSTANGQVAEKEAVAKANSEQLGKTIEDLKNKNRGATNSLKDGAKATEEVINSQQKLNSSLNSLKNRIGYILSLGNAYYQLRNIIRQTFSDIQKLDSAFASIAMVTDKTVSGLWETYGNYSKIANELGQTTESAIKASALFYQQGLDTNDALALTEDTMKLATLAGADFETATDQMTSALRGFHMEMDQGAHVTDVYSELAAHAAADVNGIAYAMSKTASIGA